MTLTLTLIPKNGGEERGDEAIANKDYTSGYPIQISVYPDHLSVWNYGQLPEGWTVGRLIESWGRGYRRIVRGNEAAGLLPPIVETEDGLRVTHYVDVAAQVNAMGAEERAIPILEHVLKNHRVTNGDVQKMLDVSKPTATRLLQKLDAVLELVGHGVGSYYRIRNY